MRDEDDVQQLADRVSGIITNGKKYNDGSLEVKGDSRIYGTERLRGILDALDWVLDEDIDEEPL